MKSIIPFLIFLIGCTPSKELESNIETIELQYVGWACDCPQWMKIEDIHQTNTPGFDCDNNDICLEIEPENPELEIPSHYWSNPRGWKRFKFTGRFYKDKQKHQGNDQTIKARTFRYSSFEYITPPWEIANQNFKIKDTIAEKIIERYSINKHYKKPDSDSGEFQSNIEKYPQKEDPYYTFLLEYFEPNNKKWSKKNVLVNAYSGEIKENN